MAYKNAKYGYVWDEYKNIADTLNLKSRDDVKKLLQQMISDGWMNEGEDDGIFGEDTLNSYEYWIRNRDHGLNLSGNINNPASTNFDPNLPVLSRPDFQPLGINTPYSGKFNRRLGRAMHKQGTSYLDNSGRIWNMGDLNRRDRRLLRRDIRRVDRSRNFDNSLKYLQGGLINLQQQMLLLFIQAIAQTLQTDPQQVAQAAQLNPQALETAVLVFQLTQDIQQAAQAFVQSFQQQVQAARHGAKLNYIRQLKHQCPEGQELVYYKQGGMVKCGCAGKKFEDGGKTSKKKQSAVERFKSRRKLYEEDMSKAKDEAARDSIRANKYNDLDVLVNRPGRYVNGVWTPDRTKSPYNKSNRLDPKTTKTLPGGKYPSYWTTKERGIWEREHGDNEQVENINKGYKKNEKGGKVKKHENGGSLNGIPFYQKGTPKGGVWPIILYVPKFKLTESRLAGTTGSSITQPGLLNEIIVSVPDKRYIFDRREGNIGGGRKVISESLFDYYGNGNDYLGDLAPTPAGRVIYTSPKGNDTLYYYNDYFTDTGNAKWIPYNHGYLQVTDKNSLEAKKKWKSLIKNNKKVRVGRGAGKEEKEAFVRALKEK